jgi:hypothetical protein
MLVSIMRQSAVRDQTRLDEAVKQRNSELINSRLCQSGNCEDGVKGKYQNKMVAASAKRTAEEVAAP